MVRPCTDLAICLSFVMVCQTASNIVSSLIIDSCDSGNKIKALNEKSVEILPQQPAGVNQEQTFKRSLKSCKEAPANQSGVYSIQLTEKDYPFDAFCEQNSFGGGWLVIQYRYDGSLDFYRNWTEYQKGFGSLDREFWIGLDRIHQLTSHRSQELMVEIRDFNGSNAYAHYSTFAISNEYEQFALQTLGAYDGTAGNSLISHKGFNFSTFDRDNDGCSCNCVNITKGAWWHLNCGYSNLNGKYLNQVDFTSMTWFHFNNNRQGLSYSRMMIREV